MNRRRWVPIAVGLGLALWVTLVVRPTEEQEPPPSERARGCLFETSPETGEPPSAPGASAGPEQDDDGPKRRKRRVRRRVTQDELVDDDTGLAPDGDELGQEAEAGRGGPPTLIALPGPPASIGLGDLRGEVCCLDWSADGAVLAFEVDDPALGTVVARVVLAEDGTAQALAGPPAADGTAQHVAPVVITGGGVLFSASTVAGWRPWLAPATGPSRPLRHTSMPDGPITDLTASDDGRVIAYIGAGGIWRWDTGTGGAGLAIGGLTSAPDLHVDGVQIAYHRGGTVASQVVTGRAGALSEAVHSTANIAIRPRWVDDALVWFEADTTGGPYRIVHRGTGTATTLADDVLLPKRAGPVVAGDLVVFSVEDPDPPDVLGIAPIDGVGPRWIVTGRDHPTEVTAAVVGDRLFVAFVSQGEVFVADLTLPVVLGLP